MSRPFIKFIKCDGFGCDQRHEHPEGKLGVGSQWVPPFWCEIYFRGEEFGTGDVTKHYCLTCTNKIIKATQEPAEKEV